jgi:esterase/lipase
MTLSRLRILWTSSLLTSLLVSLLMLSGTSSAQDNTQGRYRPEGRQIGLAAGREFDERLYEVRTYDAEPSSEAFASAMVFYPLTLSFDPPNGAVAFVPGYRGQPQNYEWWGPVLASVGYSVFILETNTGTDSLAQRADALTAAVEFIKSENQNPDSPVNNKIDPEKIAIMGHSLGGGATLAAAAALGDEIAAAIPLALYCCELGQSFEGDYSNVSAPTLVIAAAQDEIAPVEQHAKLVYDSIGSEKIYMEMTEGDHMLVTNSGSDKNTLGRFVVAFLKVHMDGRDNLAQHINDPDTEYADKFARYLTN